MAMSVSLMIAALDAETQIEVPDTMDDHGTNHIPALPYQQMSVAAERVGSALDDPRRLNAIAVLDLLSDSPSEDLDRLTRLASRLIHTPVAFVTIVDKDRNFFKSNVGAPGVLEQPLTHSFCKHVVISGKPLIIDDVTKDDMVKDNQAIKDLGVRAYAGIPMFASTGEALGTFCVLDAKPRHWTEEEVSVLQDLAEAAMVEIELREASVRLKEEQLLREETMNLLVHDFRTPLSIINAAAQTAMVDQSSLAEMLTITLSSTERMQGLVDDLLDLGRLEHGNLEPNLTSANLSQLLAEMVRDLLPFAKESDIVIEDRACPNLPLVLVDTSLIGRVITNLISNAVRYTERSSSVIVDIEKLDGKLKCSIQDFGQGIPEEMQHLIFEKYGRVLSARKNTKTPSTGLGLTFCKLSIEAMNGQIGVESVEGNGSKFWFTVPIAP